ncbi:MAG: hypothetical protein AMXMBFR61_03620 [Fimbriimonadales bacterium]
MEKGVWAYPWDLLAEPDSARRHADMGLTYVCVAARYHAVRALSYRPEGPRITTHRLGESWLDEAASLSAHYAAAGVALDAWIVCFHEDPAPDGQRVINCFGDEYPWASCPRHPEARERILSFVERTAATGAFRTLELEAFGFYGFAHGSEHDKVCVPSHAQLVEALSLCCCRRCRAATGVTAGELGQLVRPMLLDAPADVAASAHSRDSEASELLESFLEAERAARATYCSDLLAEAQQRVNGRGRIRIQVSPDKRAFGAARPVPAPDSVLPDELVVPVWSSDPAEALDAVRKVRAEIQDREGESPHLGRRGHPKLLAGFAAIPPYCPRERIAQAVGTILEAGPDGLCAYHDGMMHPVARRAYAEALAAQS